MEPEPALPATELAERHRRLRERVDRQLRRLNQETSNDGEATVSKLMERFRSAAPADRDERAPVDDLLWWASEKKTDEKPSEKNIDSQLQARAMEGQNKKMNKANSKNFVELVNPLDLMKSRLSTKKKKRIRVLWDIENVTLRKKYPTFEMARCISQFAKHLGKELWKDDFDEGSLQIKMFCYHEPFKKTLSAKDRKELASAMVTLIDVGKDKMGAADQLIIQDLELIMDDFEAEDTLVLLLSGDTDFLPVIRKMKQQGYHLACVQLIRHRENTAHKSFVEFCWKVFDFDQEIMSKLEKKNKSPPVVSPPPPPPPLAVRPSIHNQVKMKRKAKQESSGGAIEKRETEEDSESFFQSVRDLENRIEEAIKELQRLKQS